jgi:hypothetical protein
VFLIINRKIDNFSIFGIFLSSTRKSLSNIFGTISIVCPLSQSVIAWTSFSTWRHSPRDVTIHVMSHSTWRHTPRDVTLHVTSHVTLQVTSLSTWRHSPRDVILHVTAQSTWCHNPWENPLPVHTWLRPDYWDSCDTWWWGPWCTALLEPSGPGREGGKLLHGLSGRGGVDGDAEAQGGGLRGSNLKRGRC